MMMMMMMARSSECPVPINLEIALSLFIFLLFSVSYGAHSVGIEMPVADGYILQFYAHHFSERVVLKWLSKISSFVRDSEHTCKDDSRSILL